jgi:hypothetical protein
MHDAKSVRTPIDEGLSIDIDNSVKVAKYVVPARRQEFIEHTKEKESDGYEVPKDITITTILKGNALLFSHNFEPISKLL